MAGILPFLRLHLAILCSVLFVIPGFAQEKLKQTIRGRIIDADSHQPLPGATIAVVNDSGIVTGTSSGIDGYFKLEGIPIGRHTINASYMGYKPVSMPEIVVTSAKEVVLNLQLEASVVAMDAVEITATSKDKPLNEMAIISARTFSVDETERYAGSRGDPARMASNFAGVQGADDSRNDIVIRGNSPMGVLWRVEGVDIPNPNHFAIAGTAGGPVSIINNKSLSNSDFFTGAFPAEYGNTISGVFDLRMRNGNNQNHEYSGQFGFLGTELMAEGPISREKRSSYLLGYRYSTLSIFHALGIDIGTSAVPKYQDMFFKLHFPSGDKGTISVFGIGGLSDIEILISDHKEPAREIYGEQDRDQFFGTGMGMAGISYTRSFNNNTYGKFTFSSSLQDIHSRHELVYRHLDNNNLFVIDSTHLKLGYVFLEGKNALNWFVNKKSGNKHVLKFGINAQHQTYHFTDSIYNENARVFVNRVDANDQAFLLQPFFQWKYKITDDFTVINGIHSQYYSLNNSTSLFEPRAAVKWSISPSQSINAGFGVHSQLQPSYIYLHHLPRNGDYIRHNKNIGFTKSNHYIVGYDRSMGSNFRIKAETYYQQLYNIPVEVNLSSFSLINQGTGFVRFFPDSLTNSGTGENYGVELTAEKFFSKKYFLVVTASLYESKYTGSDGVKRDTDFNGNYIFNFLMAREISVGNNAAITLGTNVTAAGGKRYSPVDTDASSVLGEIVYMDSLRNTLQLKDYFRTDLKINYKINRSKVTHEIALDLVNLLDTKNVLKLTYAPDPNDPTANPIREEYQLGFLPLFYYKLDF